jgi:type I restriction enzyme, S subunit
VSDVPTGWVETKIGAIARIETGSTPPKKNASHYARDICFFKPGDLDSGRLLEFSEDMVSTTGAAAGRLLPPNTVLVTCIGNLGKSGITSAPSICNQQINAILPTPVASPQFIYYWTRTIGSWLEENSSATTISIINKGRFSEAPISIPPLPEQCRIVTKLDGLTGGTARACAELERIPKLIQKYREAILAAAIGGELTREWREAKALRGWHRTTVGNIAANVFDGPFGSNLKSIDYTESGVRVIRLENIGHLNFRDEKETFISLEKYESLRRHTLQVDDVLFSSFVSEEVRVCLFPAGQLAPAINKADSFCIRTDRSQCDPRFLAFRLACRSTFEDLKELVHGATRPRISLTQLKSYGLEIPSLLEQHEIIRRIETAFAWLDRVAAEHVNASRLLPKLDQAILAKALRGELVPQDPNDKPVELTVQPTAEGRGRRGRPTRQSAGAAC